MDRWRAHLRPRHGLLFCQRNGEPLTDKSLYKLFWTTAYRLTGKKTNPHLVRDSIVTYLRGGGATERELEVGLPHPVFAACVFLGDRNSSSGI